jgi:hypothetical protein
VQQSVLRRLQSCVVHLGRPLPSWWPNWDRSSWMCGHTNTRPAATTGYEHDLRRLGVLVFVLARLTSWYIDVVLDGSSDAACCSSNSLRMPPEKEQQSLKKTGAAAVRIQQARHPGSWAALACKVGIGGVVSDRGHGHQAILLFPAVFIPVVSVLTFHHSHPRRRRSGSARPWQRGLTIVAPL